MNQPLFCSKSSILSLLLFFALTTSVFGQSNRFNNWYFGRNAGITFNNGSGGITAPTVLAGSAMDVWEGSSAISNAAGVLQFYTDGTTVWNKNHAVMTNGTGLLGDPSATQSGVIVPSPANPNLYYIFTVAKEGGANGLKYSIVDMTASAGLGSVTTKNTALATPVTEKITVIPKCNGSDFWILAHTWGNNQFLLYEMTSTQPNPTLVSSQAIGMSHSGSTNNAIGAMKASPNGKKLALATNTGNVVEVYNFNNVTGVLSNLKTITGMNYSYGIEFSPNSRYLFVSNWYDIGGYGKKIYQFDLTTLPASASNGNNVYLYNTNLTVGALQAGPDGKIYVSRGTVNNVLLGRMSGSDTYLGRLDNPNAGGGSYTENAVNLGALRCDHGLPNFIPNYLVNTTLDFTFTGTCYGSNTDFTGQIPADADSVRYFFGDGFEAYVNNPSHTYPGVGNYTIKLKVFKGCRADSISKNITIATCSTSACNSSTGCFNSSLIINGDFENGNTGFTSVFTANNGTGLCNAGANSCGAYLCQGGYGIATTPTPCNPTWSSNIHDHTTGTGKMMMVDFPSSGSNNIWCQNVNLTAGATYCFGAYYINLLPTGTNQPTPTFTYTQNGTAIGNSNTIPENEQWNFTGVQFNATATGPVTMCIKNLNAGGVGYDVGIDDIALREVVAGTPPVANQDILGICGVGNSATVDVLGNDLPGAGTLNLASFRIIQAPPFSQGTAVANANGSITFTGAAGFNGPVAVQYQICNSNGCCANGTVLVDRGVMAPPTITGTLSVCAGAPTTLTASGGASYAWSSGDFTAAAIVSPNVTTIYTVTATSATGCIATQSVTVTVTGAAVTLTANPTAVCAGNSTTLTATGGGTYAWANSALTSATRTVSPLSYTVYTVTVTTAGGCVASATVGIAVNSVGAGSMAPQTICPNGSTNIGYSDPFNYSWSTTETTPDITVSPSASTTYTVTITDPGTGCTQVESVLISTYTPPVVTITGNLSICSGTSTTLTGNGGATSSDYFWLVGGPNGQQTNTVSPLVNTTYTVIALDANSCNSSTSVVVTVSPPPTASIAAISPICNGASVALMASGGTTYAWNNGGNTATNTVSPITTTTYTVTVSTGVNCSSTRSITVTVNPAPTANITGTTTICNGASTTLTATGGGTYNWSNSPVTATNTVSPTTATTYTVTVTAAGGCTAIKSTTVSVTALPTPAITGTASICNGESTTLTATGGGTYSWSSSPTTAAITVSPTTTTTYTVTVTAAGCTAQASRTITVNPIPTVAITGATPICAGASTTLTASGGNTYSWTPANSGASITVSPIANTTYTVTATSAVGCTKSATKFVSVDAVPIPQVNNAILCQGQTALLTASGGNTSGHTYLWAAPISTTTQTISTQNAGAYTVTVTNTTGCTASTVANVTVNALPVGVAASNTGPYCLGQNIQLNSLPNAAATYGWSGVNNYANAPQIYNQNFNTQGTTSTGWTNNATISNWYASHNVLAANGFVADNGANNTGNMYNYGTTAADRATGCLASITTGTIDFGVKITNNTGVAVNQVNVSYTGEQWRVGDGNNVDKLRFSYSTNATGLNTGTYINHTNLDFVAPIVSLVGGTLNGNLAANRTARNSTIVLATPIAAGASMWLKWTDIDDFGADAGMAVDDLVVTLLNGSQNPSIASATLAMAGDYTVTVTDANGCSATASTTVALSNPPTASIAGLSSICGAGPVTLTASGGATYNWSTNEVTASITPNIAATTTYTVTVTTAAGCSAITSTTVTVNSFLTPTISAPVTSYCNVGTPFMTASGGSTYLWDNSATSAAISVPITTTTTFTVTATNVSGCSGTANITITINPLPTVGANNASICLGQSATLTATPVLNSSGSGSFIWSSGLGTTAVVTANTLINRTYTVTVSNAYNCTATANAIVTVNALPTPFIPNTTICNGVTTGTLTATGGTSYVWNTTDATASITPSPPPTTTTTYTVTVTDANNCTAATTGQIIVNPLPTPTVADVTICNGVTNATLIAMGGGASFAWSTGGTNAFVTPNPAPIITTVYTVTVTSSAGCTAATTGQIIVNPRPVPSVSSIAICNGQTATLTETNGGGTYNWSGNLGSNASISPNPTTTTTYTVTVTSAAGCTAQTSATVTVNSLPTPVVANVVICNGASATLTETSGTGTTYIWTTSDATASITPNPAPIITTTYTVTVTNAAGCTAMKSATITVNALPTPTVNSVAVCTGQAATLTATGGGAYLWSNALGTTASINPPSTTTATYTVTVTNAAGCTAMASGTVTVNTLPTPAIANATICLGQSATLTETNGGGTYNWSGGLGSNASISPSPTTTTTYTVTVTTAAGCSAQASATITVNALPTPSVASISICNGQNASLTETSSNLTYNWSNALGTTATVTPSPAPIITTTYTVTATNAAGCTAQTSATITVNAAPTPNVTNVTVCKGQTATIMETNGGGTWNWSNSLGTNASCNPPTSTTATYTVTVTTAAGCTAEASGTVTVNSLPTPTVANVTICNGASATLTETSGTGLTYAWNTSQSTASNTPNPAPIITTTYTVTVTNADGCTAQTTASIIVNQLPNATITAIPNITTGICVGTTISLGVSGGNTYNWNTTAITPVINISPTTTTTYTVTVTNAAGCTAESSRQIVVNPLPLVTINGASAICQNSPGFTLDAPTNFASYIWSNGPTSYNIAINPNSVGTTVYTVTATDANGCTGSSTHQVMVNPIPTPTIAGQTICKGATATLTASGSSNTFAWTTGSVTDTTIVQPIITTVYAVTATNAFGCSKTATAKVIVNNAPQTAILGQRDICVGASVTLTAQNGNGYHWSNNDNTFSITVSPVVNTSYTVTASSTNGCTASYTIPITVHALPIATILKLNPDTCKQGHGKAVVMGNDPTQAYIYSWSNAATTDTLRNALGLSRYTVTITDTYACQDTAQVIIKNTGGVQILSITTLPQLCTAAASGHATVQVAQTNPRYNYKWFDNTNAVVSTDSSAILKAGTYVVQATDRHGCSVTGIAVVQPPLLPSVEINPAFTQMNLGDSLHLTAVPNAQEAYTFTWDPQPLWCKGCKEISVAPLESTIYTVTITNLVGCTATSTAFVKINAEYDVFVPNIFTPNNDGNNDMFVVYGNEGVRQITRLSIFNRWGENVFNQTNIPHSDAKYGWDGTFRDKKCMPAVFGYIIEVEFVNGKKKTFTGDVTLLE